MSEQIKKLVLKPMDMTEEILQMLEEKGLIIRLCPGNHCLEAKEGEIKWAPIYESEEKWGPHKLITVTINTDQWFNFGYHQDNEEFLFIGKKDTKPMYFVVGLMLKDEMEKKIRENTLSENDFIVFNTAYNDPSLSFFTLVKDVPHAELTCMGPGTPPSFYVTESKSLPTEKIDLKNYNIIIQ